MIDLCATLALPTYKIRIFLYSGRQDFLSYFLNAPGQKWRLWNLNQINPCKHILNLSLFYGGLQLLTKDLSA